MSAPAFQFYASDWDAGTCRLSLAARGAFISLLAVSWNTGPLPFDVAELARLARADRQEFELIWTQELEAKFKRNKHGFVNAKLESIRRRQDEYSAKQRQKGKLSGIARSNRGSTGVRTESEPRLNHSDLDLDLDLSSLNSPLPRENGRTPVVPVSEKASMFAPPTARPQPLFNGKAARDHATHAWCYRAREGFCISHQFHSEVIGKSLKSDDDVRAWYTSVMQKHEGVPVGEDKFTFWRNELAGWLGTVTSKPSESKMGRLSQMARRLEVQS